MVLVKMSLQFLSSSQISPKILINTIGEEAYELISSQYQAISIVSIEEDYSKIYQRDDLKKANIVVSDKSDKHPKIVVKQSDDPEITPLIVILTKGPKTKFSLYLEQNTHIDCLILQNTSSIFIANHHINLAKDASLKNLWCLSQHEKSETNLKTQITQEISRTVTLEENCSFSDYQVVTPQANVNLKSNIKILGQNTHSQSTGCLMSDTDQVFYEPIQEHFAPRATSGLNFNVVLSKEAKSSFSGLIILHKDAQKSNAYQQNKNLLLSPLARADSEPRLEIIPNDVMCKHGSATAELDKKQLYYLISRGFTYNKAKNMIIQSFCNALHSSSVSDKCSFQALFSIIKDNSLQKHTEILSE